MENNGLDEKLREFSRISELKAKVFKKVAKELKKHKIVITEYGNETIVCAIVEGVYDYQGDITKKLSILLKILKKTSSLIRENGVETFRCILWQEEM